MFDLTLTNKLLDICLFRIWPFRRKPNSNSVHPDADNRDNKTSPTADVGADTTHKVHGDENGVPPRNSDGERVTTDVNETDPITNRRNDQQVIDRRNKISPIIGVGGDYTVMSEGRANPVTNFGQAKEKEETEMQKIYKGQAYNHSKLTQLEHTKTEISTMCEKIPAENLKLFKERFHSIPFYVEQNVIVTDAMVDQAKQLAYLLSGLASHVFRIPIETVHIFRDINGGESDNFSSRTVFDILFL